MSDVFSGVGAPAEPSAATVATSAAPAAPADPTLADVMELVKSLSSELAVLKQNPVVQGLINADETGPDRMGQNHFLNAVKGVVGGFEDDFRALIGDELAKLGVAAAPAVAPPPAPAAPGPTQVETNAPIA